MGVLKSSPLGPVLINIFVAFYGCLLFEKCCKPRVYLHYVDDPFSIFDFISDAMAFHTQFNPLHPFTMKVCTLPFLDVLVECKDDLFITSVYHRPTFNDLYTNWNFFVSKSRKINLASTLNCELMICSPCTLNQELGKIHCIFTDNGFTSNVIKYVIELKIKVLQRTDSFWFLSLSHLFKTTVAG